MIEKPSLSRRRFLTNTLAAAGALRLAPRGFAFEPGACLLTAEQEVGPFYVADEMLRAKIAEGKPGVPLRLRLVLSNKATCAPLANAAIDLWHCDAMGLYSGFTTMRLGPPPGPGGPPPLGPDGPPAIKPTDKLTFLRGVQVTGADGSVTYETVFPGFYQGRVNHIHFKVRLNGHRSGQTYAAGHTSHVGQVFFPEELSLRLMEQAPYSAHAIHRTTLAEDGIFRGQHGSFASVREIDPANPSAGLVAEYQAAVDPTATPAPVSPRP